MKQINLKTNEFNKRRPKDKKSSSLMWGVVFLLISVALYGAVYFYRMQIAQKISSVDDQIVNKQNELDSEEFKKVYDFEKRLTELQSKISGNTKQSKNLTEIAKNTFQETYFKNVESNVELGRSDFVIDINVPDFDFLAKQITALNKMEGLEGEVSLEDSAKKESGVDAKIKFSFVTVQSTGLATNEDDVN